MLLVLLLALAAQPPALDVTVRSADGPVAGALVVIDGVESRSDALGKVTVRVVPPTTLTVQADGFLPAAVSLVAPLPSRLEVMLEAVPDIEEEVVADATRTATRLADGMLLSATTPDGCVEAFESREGAVVAVQWHPEVDAATVPHQQALFDWLVRAAA